MDRHCGHRLEPIGDLIRHDYCYVLGPRQLSEQRASLDELGTSLGHGGAARSVKLCAVVCGNGVDDDQADVVAVDGNGELVTEDVLLGLEVRGLDAEDAGKRWEGGVVIREKGEVGMSGEYLGEAGGLEGTFGGDVEGGAGDPVGCGELDGEEEG